jgi:shikimate kinase
MKTLPSIFLIGPNGAGKSTIGQLLAKQLQYTFYDTDIELESSTGVTISWIYDVEGEDKFHERQTDLLKKLVKQSNVVLATGSDVILKQENRTLLSSNGLVIFLATEVDYQLKRIRRKEHRPLLQVDDVEDCLTKMRKERTPLYQSIADVSFDTAVSSIRSVSKKIVRFLEESGYRAYNESPPE